jgi:hypothetical protein
MKTPLSLICSRGGLWSQGREGELLPKGLAYVMSLALNRTIQRDVHLRG